MEWTQLVDLLKRDLRAEGCRILPKLTYEHLHLNPSLRMKVKLAVQVSVYLSCLVLYLAG